MNDLQPRDRVTIRGSGELFEIVSVLGSSVEIVPLELLSTKMWNSLDARHAQPQIVPAEHLGRICGPDDYVTPERMDAVARVVALGARLEPASAMRWAAIWARYPRVTPADFAKGVAQGVAPAQALQLLRSMPEWRLFTVAQNAIGGPLPVYARSCEVRPSAMAGRRPDVELVEGDLGPRGVLPVERDDPSAETGTVGIRASKRGERRP